MYFSMSGSLYRALETVQVVWGDCIVESNSVGKHLQCPWEFESFVGRQCKYMVWGNVEDKDEGP